MTVSSAVHVSCTAGERGRMLAIETEDAAATSHDENETSVCLMNKVLAFDIETSGLKANQDFITVASTFDGLCAKSYLFVCLDSNTGKLQYRDDVQNIIDDFTSAMDAAPYLAAFNGCRFDLPFICEAFNLCHDRVARWVLKTYDPFEVCKSVQSRTFALNMLLKLNGIECKSGSGMHAVEQAHRGEFEDLANYCNDDARLTWNVCNMPQLLLPEGYAWRKMHAGLLCHKDNVVRLCAGRTSSGKFKQFAFYCAPAPSNVNVCSEM